MPGLRFLSIPRGSPIIRNPTKRAPDQWLKAANQGAQIGGALGCPTITRTIAMDCSTLTLYASFEYFPSLLLVYFEAFLVTSRRTTTPAAAGRDETVD